MNSSVNVRRIDGTAPNAIEQIQQIRSQLSPAGDLVSQRSRKLTEEVFGSPLTPREVVERICLDVARRGQAAVLEYCRRLDRVEMDASQLRVSSAELARAHRSVDSAFLGAIRRIRRNILLFQSGILHRDAVLAKNDHDLRLLYRPLRRVGICIPGGTAAYPSTLLMTVLPAQAAGVKQIAVVAPPTRFGANNPIVLATCAELGITEVYRIGGAQAVAALAYGIEGIEPVDKIVGPGNLFVALAKQKVSSFVGIDMLAGPTEVLILADATARPDYIAADMIAQAEHAPGASLLITWHPPTVDQVVAALSRQLGRIDRAAEARESLQEFGAIITVADENAGCQLSDLIAPEHLQIQTADPEMTLLQIRNAGAVFLGHHTPVAVGDYVAGPSHTLPTGGTARFSSGLSANDFLKRISVIRYNTTKLAEIADDLRCIAGVEGLTAHSRSVEMRLEPAAVRNAPAQRASKSKC